MTDPTDPDFYRCMGGVDVHLDSPQVWFDIPVLQFLWGKPWDAVALACVTALRPSKIRVTRGEVKSNARRWRVTVYLADDDRTIRRIEQEVGAWAPPGVRDGHDLWWRAVSGDGASAVPDTLADRKAEAEARVKRAEEGLRDAKAALDAVREAEFDARDAALLAEAIATGDLSKLPKCGFFEEGEDGCEAGGHACDKVATKSGGCEVYYTCDAHTCMHCLPRPDLPWAALVRAAEAKAR